MKTYIIQFTRSFSEDFDAVRVRLVRSNRARLVHQLGREIEDCSTYLKGDRRNAVPCMSLNWHGWARNGDSYGIVGRCQSALSLPRLRAVLQGLCDRGVAGNFNIIEARK